MLIVRQKVLSKGEKVRKNLDITLIPLMKHGLKKKPYSIVVNNLINREQ